MIFDVLVYRITTNYSGSWNSDTGLHTISADNFLHVRLDDSDDSLSVMYSSASAQGAGTEYGILTEGPNLFFGFGGAAQLITAQPYHQWCDSTTLKKINVLSNFPYSFISSNPNASECILAPTCDLEISSIYTITDATGPSTPDGSIVISAASSNGTIKYSLDADFDYATEGQTSTTFSGLLPDFYTIYAKDAIGCQDNVSFEIPITTLYGVKYRLDFTDMLVESSKLNRTDILERAYSGPVIEFWSGEKPVTIRYEGDRDDPNVALVPSNAVIQLLVRTQGEFNELFLGDDRKYLVNHYIGDDEPGLEIYWTGYVIPEFHSEPYLFEPYVLEITASDGLGELKNADFKDINDNVFKGELSAIKIIAEILKKTALDINIRSGINVFDSGMTTGPDDDPLEQVYIDSRIYYSVKKVPDKCDEVLKTIVDPFRGQIFQSMGVWWIIRLSDAVGTFPYREFDIDGVYDSNDTINCLKELDFPSAIHAAGKVMFANRTQTLTFIRNYGYFAINHDLGKDGNLIDEGRFESEDIIELASGNKTFKNWNVLIGQSGITTGHETVVNGDSTGAFFFQSNEFTNAQNDTQLYSAVIPMDNFGSIRFIFQYMVTPRYNVPYIRIAWVLKFTGSTGSYWLTYGSNGSLGYEFSESINEIYVTTYDQWQTFDITHQLPAFDVQDVQIQFYMHNHYGRDFADEAALRAFSLRSLENPNGFRRMMVGDTGETNLYIGEYGNDADSFPDVVRPDDYNVGAGTKDWIWRLDKVITLGPNVSLINRIKFDNVSLAFYPLTIDGAYIDPPETLVYEEETDVFVTPNFIKEIRLGDLIRLNNNYPSNERNLYRGFFRLADGTPTANWARVGVDESKRILQILLEDYVAQFSTPQRRLSGLKIATNVLHFINCLRDNIDGTRYRPMTFEFDVKNAMYTPDMSGVLAGEDGEPPYAPGAFENNAFSTGFLIGN